MTGIRQRIIEETHGGNDSDPDDNTDEVERERRRAAAFQKPPLEALAKFEDYCRCTAFLREFFI